MLTVDNLFSEMMILSYNMFSSDQQNRTEGSGGSGLIR